MRPIGSILLAAVLFACTPGGGAEGGGASATPNLAAGADGTGPAPGAVVGRPGAPQGRAPEGAAPGVVVDLVDGDTIDVDLAGLGRERVRLIGIDTPETRRPDSPVECYGPEASAYLAQLIPIGTRVGLLRDVESRDQYGRLLAYVFRASDGLFVNLTMVADGYADQLSIEPNTTFAAEFGRLVAEARRVGRGMWSACPAAATGGR